MSLIVFARWRQCAQVQLFLFLPACANVAPMRTHWRQLAKMKTMTIEFVHIGATWRIQLNRPSAAAMQPYVKLL